MLRRVRQDPSAILLVTQLAAVLLYPFMEESEVGRALFSVLGILVLALVLLAIRRSPANTWVAVLLGVPATCLLLVQAVTGDDHLLPYSSAFEAVLYFYAAGALIAYMLEDHEITRDELFAVGATFTLVAWAFAYTFTVVQAIEPGSFTAAIDPTGERSWMELLFLSFTTLTSTGLSDVVPVEALRAQRGDDRAGRRPLVRRDARLAPGRPDRPRQGAVRLARLDRPAVLHPRADAAVHDVDGALRAVQLEEPRRDG